MFVFRASPFGLSLAPGAQSGSLGIAHISMCMPAVVSPARYLRELGLLPTHEPGGRYSYRGGEARAARRWEWHVLQGSTQSAPVKGKGRRAGKGKQQQSGASWEQWGEQQWGDQQWGDQWSRRGSGDWWSWSG